MRGNRKIILIRFFLLIFVFFLSGFKLYSQETITKVIVIKENAEVRLFPTEESAVFKKLTLGTVLEVESTKGEWLKIVLPPEDGVVIKGYILKSMVVEAIEKAPPEPKGTESEKDVLLYFDLAEKFFKEGNYKKAKEYFERVLKERPDDPGSKRRIEEIKKINERDYNLRLGDRLYDQGYYKTAMTYYENVLKLFPEDEEVKGKVKKIEELTRSEEVLAVNKPPKVIKKINPKYPKRAFDRRIEGLVVLEVKIDKSGKIQDVKVIKSFSIFDKEAVKAVRQWVYEPMIINGIPRAVVFTVKLRFEIGK